MKKLDSIFLVYGDKIDEKWSNVKSLDTKVVPNIGETLMMTAGSYRVIDKVIDYRQVSGYDGSSPDRGGELVYIFIRKL